MRKDVIKDYIVISIGTMIVAIAIYFFMIPQNIVAGSISGLALLLSEIIHLPVSLVLLGLNVISFLAGLVLLGREFGIKTAYVSVLLPAILNVFEQLFPDIQSLTGDIILDMLCLIITISAGQTLLFNVNASSGGIDIIAKIVNKYLHIEIGKALALLGTMIVVCSIFIYDIRTVIIGLLINYFNGILVDEYIAGFSRKKRICILSERHEEIKQYILKDINRGVTLYPVKGGYSGESRVEIITILNKNEYALLMDFIKRVDEQAFVTVSTISEVAGMWNMKGRKTV